MDYLIKQAIEMAFNKNKERTARILRFWGIGSHSISTIHKHIDELISRLDDEDKLELISNLRQERLI